MLTSRKVDDFLIQGQRYFALFRTIGGCHQLLLKTLPRANQ
ncbi:MAG: hypothetical protein ACKPFF_25290 [Planktothrix sp.]